MQVEPKPNRHGQSTKFIGDDVHEIEHSIIQREEMGDAQLREIFQRQRLEYAMSLMLRMCQSTPRPSEAWMGVVS